MLVASAYRDGDTDFSWPTAETLKNKPPTKIKTIEAWKFDGYLGGIRITLEDGTQSECFKDGNSNPTGPEVISLEGLDIKKI